MAVHWTERSPGTPPAVVEEESADKVTVVLAAAVAVAAGSEGILLAGPVDAGCVLVAAVEAGTVPAAAAAVAVRGVAEVPVWILGSWAAPVIQGELGNLAAVEPDWVGPAAGSRETGQTVGLGPRLGNKVAETAEALEMGLAVAPGTVGAYVTVDRGILLGCEGQMLEVGETVLGMVSDHPVVLVAAGRRGIAAGLDEDPGRVDHNMMPGLESHNHLVLADHKIPSVAHMACYSCLQVYVLAFQLDISEELGGHIPGQGSQAPAVEL